MYANINYISDMVFIFDLDGTIIDSFEGIKCAMNETLEKYQLNIKNDDHLRSEIGKPLFDILNTIICDENATNDAVVRFRELYNEKYYCLFSVYDFAEDFLMYLKEKNHDLFIVTNKSKLIAEKILKKSGLDRYFKNVYGTSLYSSGNKKEYLKSLITSLDNFDIKQTCFIGDTLNDYEAADLFGIPVVIMKHGYGNDNDFKDKKLLFSVSDFTELKHLMSTNVFV